MCGFSDEDHLLSDRVTVPQGVFDTREPFCKGERRFSVWLIDRRDSGDNRVCIADGVSTEVNDLVWARAEFSLEELDDFVEGWKIGRHCFPYDVAFKGRTVLHSLEAWEVLPYVNRWIIRDIGPNEAFNLEISFDAVTCEHLHRGDDELPSLMIVLYPHGRHDSRVREIVSSGWSASWVAVSIRGADIFHRVEDFIIES